MKKLLNKEAFKSFIIKMFWFLLYAVSIISVLCLIGYLLYLIGFSLLLGVIGAVIIGVVIGLTK